MIIIMITIVIIIIMIIIIIISPCPVKNFVYSLVVLNLYMK